MKRTYKYTILTTLLAIVFSLSSMAGMNLILRIREHHLLSEHGELVTEGIVREWQKPETVSVEKIEKVIGGRGEDWVMTVHDPISGQISMDEAVKAGKVWLTQVEWEVYGWVAGYDPDKSTDSHIRSIYAALGTLGTPSEVQKQPYYSFWKIYLTSHSLETVLYVNAVTSGIWRAELTFYDNLPEQMPYWKLKDFLQSSGLSPHYKGAVTNEEGTSAVWDVTNSRLCARMDFSCHDDNGYRKDLPDFDETIIDETMMKRENVTIIMRLEVKDEDKDFGNSDHP